MPFTDLGAGGDARVACSARNHKVTIGLDLSSETGWCAGDPESGETPVTGMIRLYRKGGLAGMCVSLENELAALIEEWQPVHIVVERHMQLAAMARCSSDQIMEQQVGLEIVARMEAYRASCGFSAIDVHTARRDVLGQGRFSKDQVKYEVVRHCKRVGIAVDTHHAADAAVVWLWRQQRVRGFGPCAGPLWRGLMQ